MNPARWSREVQVAGAICILLGAAVGVLCAWFQSPFFHLSQASLSCHWANSTNAFLTWLQYPGLYWPWPFIGAILAALAFYAIRLLNIAN